MWGAVGQWETVHCGFLGREWMLCLSFLKLYILIVFIFKSDARFTAVLSRRFWGFHLHLDPTYTWLAPPSPACPTRVVYFYNWWTYIDASLSSKVYGLCPSFILGPVHSMGFKNCIQRHMSTIIVSEYFHCPKSLFCFAHSFLPPHNPWQPIDLFTVSIVLLFPECHIVGIIQIIIFTLASFTYAFKVPPWLSMSL